VHVHRPCACAAVWWFFDCLLAWSGLACMVFGSVFIRAPSNVPVPFAGCLVALAKALQLVAHIAILFAQHTRSRTCGMHELACQTQNITTCLSQSWAPAVLLHNVCGKCSQHATDDTMGCVFLGFEFSAKRWFHLLRACICGHVLSVLGLRWGLVNGLPD
jgi:hypothetical protein